MNGKPLAEAMVGIGRAVRELTESRDHFDEFLQHRLGVRPMAREAVAPAESFHFNYFLGKRRRPPSGEDEADDRPRRPRSERGGSPPAEPPPAGEWSYL